MSRLRFSSAHGVFEAFPSIVKVIKQPPTEEPPLTYLDRLAQGATPEDAISFSAFVLPRREAVWWALQSVRAMKQGEAPEDIAALQTADAWVREPSDERRRAAMRAGETGDANRPSTWVAWAAGYSGGTIIEDHPIPCPPEMTGLAARIGVLIALATVPAHERETALRGCVERCVRLADGIGG